MTNAQSKHEYRVYIKSEAWRQKFVPQSEFSPSEVRGLDEEGSPMNQFTTMQEIVTGKGESWFGAILKPKIIEFRFEWMAHRFCQEMEVQSDDFTWIKLGTEFQARVIGFNEVSAMWTVQIYHR